MLKRSDQCYCYPTPLVAERREKWHRHSALALFRTMTEAVSPSVIFIREIEPNMILLILLLKRKRQIKRCTLELNQTKKKRGTSSMIVLSDDDVIEPPRVHVFIAQEIISWSFFSSPLI